MTIYTEAAEEARADRAIQRELRAKLLSEDIHSHLRELADLLAFAAYDDLPLEDVDAEALSYGLSDCGVSVEKALVDLRLREAVKDAKRRARK